MKHIKTLIIVCVAVLSANTIKAQSYMQLKTYQDTANYLIHEIQIKKDKYEGKSFSTLLNDLKIKPTNIILGGWYGGDYNKDKFGKDMTIDFNFEREANNQHFISIDFKNIPADFETLYALCFPSSKRDINKIFNLYKNTIVTRVGVKLYSSDEPPRPGITDNSNL